MKLLLLSRLLLFLAASAVLAGASARPAAADSHHDSQKGRSHQGRVWVSPDELHAQNLVFPGHDGHIMPPTSQDWAEYYAAEARRAQRSLFPCFPPQDDHGKRLY